MEKYEGDYPPNPTDMTDENYKEGVNILFSLLKTNGDVEDPRVNHINSVLNSPGVDAALYLLYYGHRVKEEIYGYNNNPYSHQREFKTLLQTAASIGAMISKEKITVLDKLDNLWNITSGEDNNV